jgi:hypothetical protein
MMLKRTATYFRITVRSVAVRFPAAPKMLATTAAGKAVASPATAAAAEALAAAEAVVAGDPTARATAAGKAVAGKAVAGNAAAGKAVICPTPAPTPAVGVPDAMLVNCLCLLFAQRLQGISSEKQ